jgi:hypothetical protein
VSDKNKKHKCFLDTTTYELCPDNCRNALSLNTWMGNYKEYCIADEKLTSFLKGEVTFTIAVSAFLQAQAQVIDSFSRKSPENLDLVRYFFGICEPEQIKDIADKLSNDVLYQILHIDYENYMKVRKMYGKKPEASNYFAVKSSRFWKQVSNQKICDMIVYLLREKQSYSLASQFLLILPSDVMSEFNKYTDLSEEDERNLYLALEDNIYNLPIISPKIYDHMLALFKDNLEIFFILETMAELVKRRAAIEDITTSFIRYYKKSGHKLTIQWIYSELYGLEYELVAEVLDHLKEREYISASEKTTLQNLLKSGSLDSLKDIKLEILNNT